MQIETAEHLIQALRASGLFSSEQLKKMVRELKPLGDDTPTLMRHILQREWMSLYQLRKILHGKTAELHLGSYVLHSKIGEGGMGKVYRCVRKSDGQSVALKIVRPILLANPVIRKRYAREVSTSLSLKHPNIVTVFDAGEVDGRYYLAMEFVDGIDLSRMVKEFRPLAVAEACEYARQAALGLHYAHKAGFVHRDIKPSNILVAGERHIPQATEPAVVKIVDMGLIRAVEAADDVKSDLTRDGTVVGTPDYMSPEQAKNSSTVDHRADLYSLGCTLYFMLAGQPPFPHGSPIEKIIKHQVEAPPPLQALRRDVPSAVAEVIAKLMAKKPDDRYPSARKAAKALEPLAVYPTGARPVRIHVRDKKPRTPAEEQTTASNDTPVPETPNDRTPPANEQAGPLHASSEMSSFVSLNDPASGEFSPMVPTRTREPRRKDSPLGGWMWLLFATALLIAAGIGLWLAFNAVRQKPRNAFNATEAIRRVHALAMYPTDVTSRSC